MKLRETLKKKTALTTWIDFRPDMKIGIEYADLPEFNRMLEVCEVDGDSLLPGEKVEQYDEEKFNEQLANKIIGLKGFTLGKVLELTSYDVPKGADLDADVDFSTDTLLFLIEELFGFKKLVRDSIMQIGRFKEAQGKIERKNSGNSQGSDSE